jgi:hypothetical protein
MNVIFEIILHYFWATLAPSAASIVAIAAPSPALDPVTRARRPIHDKSIETSLSLRYTPVVGKSVE